MKEIQHFKGQFFHKSSVSKLLIQTCKLHEKEGQKKGIKIEIPSMGSS